MLVVLLEEKKNVVLRCVLITGINDTTDHFKQLSLLQENYPNITQIDLLPYHKLRKKQVFHLVNEREFYEVADERVRKYWREEVKKNKLKNVVLENERIG
jgi:pyruvate formate lyase activating enzyme